MSTHLDELFESNRRWATETERRTPGFFTSLLAQQAPQYLWIGCADSRVPANEILGLLPGDVFVHRNVANVVVHSNRRVGQADNWIRHVQDVRNKHRAWLDGMDDETLRLKALCELNVLEQSLNVCETTVVQDAWERGQSVVVHGWVYGLHNGLIEDLKMTVANAGEVAAAYGLALGALKTRFDAIRKNGKP
jgi:carbonic anhydrase